MPSTPKPAKSSGPTAATVRSSSISRTMPRRSAASPRKGRWWRLATACWSPAADPSRPATDRRTGKLLYFHLADYSKVAGGAEVLAQDGVFTNGGAPLRFGRRRLSRRFRRADGFDPRCSLRRRAGRMPCLRPERPANRSGESLDRRGRRYRWSTTELPRLAAVSVPPVAALTRMGTRLYLAAPGHVFAFDLPLRNDSTPSWQAPIEGTPIHLVAADGRLLVSTSEGRLYCFGPTRRAGGVSPLLESSATDWPNRGLTPPARPSATGWHETAAKILQTTNIRAGYCVAWGIGSGELITELARQSDLRIIAVESDAPKQRLPSLLAGRGIGCRSHRGRERRR